MKQEAEEIIISKVISMPCMEYTFIDQQIQSENASKKVKLSESPYAQSATTSLLDRITIKSTQWS